MENIVSIEYDVDNNQIIINDSIGMVNEIIPVLSDIELDCCENELTYIARYKQSIAELMGDDLESMYFELVKSTNIKIEVVSPFEFTPMTSNEFYDEFGSHFNGVVPITLFVKISDDDNLQQRIDGEASCKVYYSDGEVMKFINDMSPIIYMAYKNDVGEYRLRYYTQNNNQVIISSKQYRIMTGLK